MKITFVAGCCAGLLGLAGLALPQPALAKQQVQHKAQHKAALININSASAKSLNKIKGIKPATAKAIVAYRDKHGPFASIAELTKVPGVSAKTLKTIRSRVTI